MIDLDNVFKVYEVTAHIKNILERNIDILQIEGEVSNLSLPASGHIYFSLKDEKALLRCVFFAGYNRKIDFIPKNGDKVIVTGKITVYERDGQYQLIVSNISQYGIGNLHEQFERLKAKLKEEGLFDETHKKTLPKYPSSIGIVTSETGAALQDILNILSRRYPVNVYLYSAVVQGSEAPLSLVNGINYFAKSNVDVIIIGRGGGSYEDLFCFNDEALARAIYACPIPVISAVGHEIDFTICDFVSDIRAATPSVAAEIATPNRQELLENLANKGKQLHSLINTKLQEYNQKTLLADKKIKAHHPQNIIYKQQQTLDYATLQLLKFKTIFDNIKNDFLAKKQLFKNQLHLSPISQHSLSLKHYQDKLSLLTKEKLNTTKAELSQKEQILKSHSPLNILNKGYALIQKEGNIITSKANLKTNDKINIKLKDGQCEAEVV
jgi:exodeoxyribonuclease VII large subunit